MVGRVQEHLEAIYGIRCEWRASEFLVDEDTARRLGGQCFADEELLVVEGGDELEVALFIARGLLERLERYEHELPAAVHDELPAYCQLIEGVSHFLYLAQAAALERKVSLLELEAQAEVDKFASCLLCRWSDGEKWADELLERLFDRVHYREHLGAEERSRYEEANRLAKRYCRKLSRLAAGRSVERLLGELRYGYRLGAEAKLRYFAAAS